MAKYMKVKYLIKDLQIFQRQTRRFGHILGSLQILIERLLEYKTYIQLWTIIASTFRKQIIKLKFKNMYISGLHANEYTTELNKTKNNIKLRIR